jgi:hypothetical protein
VHLHIFAVLSAQFGENLFHGMKIIADLSVGPHFALSASFGKGRAFGWMLIGRGGNEG